MANKVHRNPTHFAECAKWMGHTLTRVKCEADAYGQKFLVEMAITQSAIRDKIGADPGR